MSKVYLDELNAALSSSTFSTLEADANDSNSVGSSIKSFVDGSSTALTGEQWDKVRSKLGVYDSALAKRVSVANNLSSAIKEALTMLKNYMLPYKYLDTSKLDEYETAKKQAETAKENLTNMLKETVTVSYKQNGVTKYTTKPKYDPTVINQQLQLAEKAITELDKIITKIKGLDAVYSKAESLLSTAFQEVTEFQRTASAITPSGKFSYQK